MSINEIESKARELKELKLMAEELAAEIATIEDEIKAHMTATDAEQITAGVYKITWKQITSSRLDSAALKKALPEVAARFTKQTTIRRFTVQ